MNLLGSIGILVSIAVLIYLAFRGVSILIIGPLTAALIVLSNKMVVTTALFSGATSYMGGLGSFVTSYLLIFILGAILGKYLEDSGAALAIANSILKVIGRNSAFAVLIAVTLIGALLTYGGVNVFIVVFTIVALARPLFQALDIAWHIVLAPIALGCATFTMAMLPGSPAIQNIIPTTVLGTTLTAAPLVGIVSTLVVVTFGLVYMKWQLKSATAKGEVFVATGKELGFEDRELPSLALALIPMIVLIGIILVGSVMEVSNIIIPALIVGILVAMGVLNKYIPSHLATLNSGAANAMGPAVFTAAAVGVGTVVATAPGFKSILAVIQGIPGGPVVQIAAITGFMAAVTGSPSGAEGIVMASFGKAWLATGVAPEVIHRIVALAAAALGAMPHNGTVFALMGITGLTHSQCYKHIFWIMMVGCTLALISGLIVSVLFY